MNVQRESRLASAHDALALAVVTAINLACGSGMAAAQTATQAEDDAYRWISCTAGKASPMLCSITSPSAAA
jgi:hypothetical protein